MERVIVTVRRKDEPRERDLEVPAEIESNRLAELIARALRWDSDAAGQPVDYRIEVYPLGRFLRPDESLKSAGVWDGARLTLHPVGSGSMPSVSPQKKPVGPVSGWRPLDIVPPSGSDQDSAPPEEKKPSSGFVWKRVD